MFLKIHSRKTLVVVAVLCCLFVYLAAIYCLPFIDIQPQIPKRLPQVRYDFSRAPLLSTGAKEYKIDKLFNGQIRGAESIEADSSGNLYMAIEGGFILFAQMNESSSQSDRIAKPKLWLLAELNEPASTMVTNNAPVNRACQLDENVYGSQLSVGGHPNGDVPFHTHVAVSRCSKPLGIRLSRNEDYLYVIDTLRGLYQIDLKQAHDNLHRRANSNGQQQRDDHSKSSIAKILLNFSIKTKTKVPLERMDNEIDRVKMEVPVAMTAIDDLVIDYGSGTNGADVIYMTDASQSWLAINYFFDFMEGRPTGLILRYDLGSNLLSAFDNAHLSRVRMSPAYSYNSGQSLTFRSTLDDNGTDTGIHQALPSAMASARESDRDGRIDGRDSLNSRDSRDSGQHTRIEGRDSRNGERDASGGYNYDFDSMGYGAPRFDSSDIFDDRPLFFPNGIELMDDRQALLIADTSNKRIIKHFIRGPRKGQSDLWTWTPNHPDNIRRGRNRHNRETYWVAGCGKDRSTDTFLESLISEDTLNDWPRLRMFLLKQIYFIGWMMETLGQTRPFRSQYIRDYGYSLKMGLSLMDNFCEGVMILQYNRNGKVIRAIHGRDFPHDMKLLSQITEVNHSNNPNYHSLYLSSPVYDYVYRLSFTAS